MLNPIKNSTDGRKYRNKPSNPVALNNKLTKEVGVRIAEGALIQFDMVKSPSQYNTPGLFLSYSTK